MRDDARGVEEHPHAQAVAVGARALRVVEREQPRLELGDAVAADRARELVRERERRLLRLVDERDERDAFGHVRAPSRSSRPAACSMSGFTASRSMTTSMSCFLRLSSFGGSSSSTTSPSMRARRKPCVLSSSSFSVYSPLRACTTGASSMIFVPGGQRHHGVDHLRDVLRLERRAVLGAARNAGARVEQAQVVVDLGDGADRRPRVVRRASSARSRSRATGPRCGRRRASPSSTGTGARRRTATRRSGAGPRRTACRTRATTCRSPTGP